MGFESSVCVVYDIDTGVSSTIEGGAKIFSGFGPGE